MRIGKLSAMVCLCFIAALPATAGIWVSAPGKASVTKSGTATTTSPVHFLAISQFSGVFEGRFANCHLHHFEFAGLLSKGIKSRHQS